MSGAHYRLGIDLGGTKIEGVVLDAACVTQWRERIPTQADRGYEHIVSRIVGLHARMLEVVGDARWSLGVGTPGAISAATGLLKNSNTTVMNGRPLALDLARAIGHPLRIENDANCFALAEACLGAARGHRVVFGVIAGTGCGGGVVIDGRILTGRNRIAGEWGHIPIDPTGAPCFCGARGCVETFVSGPGIASQYASLTGQTQSAEQVVARWQQGEYVARDVMERVFSAFGRGLAAVAGILDPDIIVLGGGLSNVPGLCERVRESLIRDVFSDTCDTPVVRHHLGDSAGVIGAALIGDERPMA